MQKLASVARHRKIGAALEGRSEELAFSEELAPGRLDVCGEIELVPQLEKMLAIDKQPYVLRCALPENLFVDRAPVGGVRELVDDLWRGAQRMYSPGPARFR